MAKNQNGSATTKPGKRSEVELPTIEIEETDAPLSARGGGKANPFVPNVKVANENRGKVYQVKGMDSKPVADKVVRMLQAAGRENGCSVRASWIEDDKVVRFRAVDLVERKTKVPA